MLSLFSALGGTLKILIMKICIFLFIFSSPGSIFKCIFKSTFSCPEIIPIVNTGGRCRISGMGEENCFLSDIFNSMNLLIFLIMTDFIFICCSIVIWYRVTVQVI